MQLLKNPRPGAMRLMKMLRDLGLKWRGGDLTRTLMLGRGGTSFSVDGVIIAFDPERRAISERWLEDTQAMAEREGMRPAFARHNNVVGWHVWLRLNPRDFASVVKFLQFEHERKKAGEGTQTHP